MKYDPRKHHRRSIRLAGYDYTLPGAYFITIVTWQRECHLGEISGGKMKLSRTGKIAAREWALLNRRFPFLALDEFVVMPNHLHAIVHIKDQKNMGAGSTTSVPKDEPLFHLASTESDSNPGVMPRSLGAVIRAYKANVTRYCNHAQFSDDKPVWQRNYYERIIRNERELDAIRSYIRENPARWFEDREN